MPHSFRKRSLGFFGLHFDFHCTRNDKKVGGRTTPAMVRSILSAVRPDFVQIDCKGHPGISSYATKVGNAAPGLVRDQLGVWRRATRTAKVPLVMHYSGVWDAAALAANPAWARLDRDGKAHESATSVFSPYADQLMIPQLIELARDEGVDAVWADGECWGHGLDWSEWSRAVWEKNTGRADLPKDATDKDWQDFVDHCREGFRTYLRHWVDAVHAACPGFEVASNWAFSSMMPEPVSANVDFLSGDFMPIQSAQSARIQARCLMHQGKPWDLMAWGFGTNFDGLGSDKTAIQLCQEAALVLSLGGGFHIYTCQQRDGYVPPFRVPVFAEVAKFCRAREELCHHAEAVPQVAVLFSFEDFRRRCPDQYPGNWPGLRQLEGVLRLCLDTRRHVDVLADHQAKGNLARYAVIVVPECHHMADDLRSELEAYLRAGGSVLTVGPRALAALGLTLPFTTTAPVAEGIRALYDPNSSGGTVFGSTRGAWQAWKTRASAKVLTTMHGASDTASDPMPGAVSCQVGKGRLVAVACELGNSALDHCSSVITALMSSWLRHLDPLPLVEVEGAGRIEVACMRKDGELRIHLTNLEGPHDARGLTWNAIPPSGELRVRIRIPGRPEVRWQPENIVLLSRRTRDGLVVEVPGFALHGALCLRLSEAVMRTL